MRYLELVDTWNGRVVQHLHTPLTRRYCCLVFRAEVSVRRCNATLELVDIPKNAERFHCLHWADDPYTHDAFSQSKDVEEGGLARLDIIFTGVSEYYTEPTGASGASLPPEAMHRASTVSASGVLPQHGVADGLPDCQGAWIATPISLSWPVPGNQQYLPHGQYRSRLSVVSEKGKVFSADITLKSPTRGGAVEVEVESVEDRFL